MKVLCIGHSAYDITSQTDKFPEENSKNYYKDVIESGGGGAANMAYTLGKLGVETYLGSAVGDDTYGTLIKQGLEKIGVHTEYMEVAYEKRTSLSFLLASKEKNSRTAFIIEKEPLLLKKSEFAFEPDAILVDGYDYGASLSVLNKYPTKISIIDAGKATAEIIELCKYVKYIVASKEFAENVAGQKIVFENPQSLVNVFSKLLNKFPNKEIIVTLEDKGAMFTSGGQIKVMPGLKANAVDTTGAGDIFHGAFTYGLMQGYDIEKSITFANIAAGLSVTKVGVWPSVPELKDILVYFDKKYGVTDSL